MKLSYEINPYGGAVLDISDFSGTNDQFLKRLKITTGDMLAEELQLAWLFLPLECAHLVDSSVSLGFTYHHADQSGLQLVLKLNENAFVPAYATHYIGAGGVVIDEHNRILVIQEKYHKKKHYKLPGGGLDQGEHISDAVVREVLEETGIRTEFISLNCFRHWHGYRYGKSDIYFVCTLKPLSSEITPDPSEISAARWMAVDEYLTDPDTHPFNRKIVKASLSSRGLKIGTIPEYGSPETHEMMF